MVKGLYSQANGKRPPWFDVHHTGPGTLAGRYMRLFWHPIFHSEELPTGRANSSIDYEFKARMVPGCITEIMDGGWALESEIPSDKGRQGSDPLRVGSTSE